MAKAKPETKVKDFKLKPMRIQRVQFEIEGIEPGLLCNKAPEEISSGRKDDRTDDEKLHDSLYHLDPPRDKAKYGFPSQGIKASLSNGGRFVNMKMTEIRGSMFVVGGPDGLIPLYGEWKEFITSARANGKALIRSVRPRFEPGWTMMLPFEWNPEAITLEELANLIEVSGFGVGIGNWRPELKGGGPYGRFRVKGVREVKA